jgi:UDP-glucose:(heptosyl)LPS alpha-1,3-glucosyltransferase
MSVLATEVEGLVPAKAVGRHLRIAVVTPELHRHGGTERGNAEVVARLAAENQICLFAHHWEPDGTPNICFHRVRVLPWPGLLRFLSFFLSASHAVERARRRHGGFDAIYSPGPNCRQVQVSSAWFCQARQLAVFRSGKHRPAPATGVDWLKLWHRWSYAAVVARVEKMFYGLDALQKVVTQSHLLARDLQQFYGLNEKRVVVAHGGVNCEHFLPAKRTALRERARHELEIGANEFVFLFIGNNWLIKGLYHVIRALPQVPSARLMVVGLGAERPKSWQKYASQLGVAERIRFLPKRPDILYYYAAADALLAPSVYDTFPLMPMEAMACGLPTIISRTTGVAEIVGPDDTLVVEQLDDSAELTAAMRRMVEDAELRARLVANGLRLARRHPWDGICRAIAAELLRTAEANAAAQRVKS